MDHTYLRYHCADSFGLTVAAASSKAPAVSHILDPIDNKSVVTVAGSQIACWRAGNCIWKWGHQSSRHNIGLNDDEIVCLEVAVTYVEGKQMAKIASGWVDGTVRIVDIDTSRQGRTLSLFDEQQEKPPEALVLRGHSNPVRVLVFDTLATRLLSGASDGAIIVWDVVTEAGLFRLLGHKGSIADLHFLGETRIVSSCMGDGLIKVWDLTTQACTQTIANHQASASIFRVFQEDRMRLIAGGSDGQLRVWTTTDIDVDEPFSYQGKLPVPANMVISNEKIMAMRIYGKRFVGILHANSKVVNVYGIRKVQATQKKRIRRLKRRKEKQKKVELKPETRGKRGILDDDDDEEQVEDTNEENEESGMDPEATKASDEFEFVGAIRASHKVRSFCFVAKENGEIVRITCALSTNALETHCLFRKLEA